MYEGQSKIIELVFCGLALLTETWYVYVLVYVMYLLASLHIEVDVLSSLV